jgi:deazaflavin-dependent oxidoreductase (nitroreductase family)
MTTTSGKPGFIWRFMRSMNQRMIHNYHRGIGPTRMVLLLTTTGRKSGLSRVTPLQYEEIDGDYYVGSARGAQSDWYRNMKVDQQVEVEVKGKKFKACAETITDPAKIADFFEIRLKRHPIMIGLLMRLEGLPLCYNREDLERFAARKALAVIRQDQPG